MKHIFTGFISLIGAIALLALAVGCANTQQTENLLSAAGFRTIIANTPQRQEHLKTLPSDRVTVAQRHGKTYTSGVSHSRRLLHCSGPGSALVVTLTSRVARAWAVMGETTPVRITV